MSPRMRITMLCGGVGGAKLALGLSHVVEPDCLTIVVNTADDFEHFGLHISPDIDTVIYTLAGLANPILGWGRADETWGCMEILADLAGETWFKLGDRDLAMHLRRTALLKSGMSLTEVTQLLSRRLGIGPTILPMTDGAVRTELVTEAGILDFQHYFVRDLCAPKLKSIRFKATGNAKATDKVVEAISSNCDAVIIAPSNPFLSVDPILSLPGIRSSLSSAAIPVVAIAPIMESSAFKGPTTKIMTELGMPVSAYELARYYCDFVDYYIVDKADAHLIEAINGLGLAAEAASILMDNDEAKERLAQIALRAARSCCGRLP